MRILIQANDFVLTKEELAKLVPTYLVGSGKTVKAYTLAHEGITSPRVIGEGTKTLKWPRKAIQSLKNAVNIGTPFYKGHGDTNNRSMEDKIGKVIATAFKTVHDKLHHLVVGVFEKDDPKLDVVSMEAEATWADDGTVETVDSVSGIAVGSSDINDPAFPGAVLHGAMQCFVSEPVDLDGNKDGVPKKGEGDSPMSELTFQDVVAGVKRFNIHPNQLFTLEEIKDDRKFGPIIDQAEKDKAQVAELTKNLEEANKKASEAVLKVKGEAAKTTLEGMLKTGFAPKQAEFIKMRFKPEQGKEYAEEDLKAVIESLKTEYAEMATHFGITSEKGGPSEKGKEKPVTEKDSGKEDSSSDDPVAAAVAAVQE